MSSLCDARLSCNRVVLCSAADWQGAATSKPCGQSESQLFSELNGICGDLRQTCLGAEFFSVEWLKILSRL